jgi:hypothetical protein
VPDVWVRLLAHCAEDPAAQPAVTKFVLRQLDNQQCQIFELQQQHKEELAASRAEAAELRGRVQVQVLERQQEQVAADRAEAAELRARVQALEGQLQEVLAALRQPLLQA